MAIAPKTKPPGCLGCPRYLSGLGFVEPIGDPEAQFIIMGQAPGPDDGWQSKPFFEKSYVGKRITRRLEKAGLTRDEVILTSLVWCADAKETPWSKLIPPAHAAIKHCWTQNLGPYLRSITNTSSEPRHIITVGAAPARWFKGMTQKMPIEPHYGTCELHEAPEVKCQKK